MNIIISIHKPFINQILSGEKPWEFRTNLPKNIAIGDKVFMYETYFDGGAKRVVGEFIIKSIRELSMHTRCGTYNYLDYYAKHILKDEDAFNRIERCKKINVSNYYQDVVFSYMYLDKCLDFIEKNDKLPPSPILDQEFWDMRAKADDFLFNCDNWLIKIGFTNGSGYCYPYGFEIENYYRYDTPIPITEFSLPNGKRLEKAPQSWCYTSNI